MAADPAMRLQEVHCLLCDSFGRRWVK